MISHTSPGLVQVCCMRMILGQLDPAAGAAAIKLELDRGQEGGRGSVSAAQPKVEGERTGNFQP